MLNSIKINFFVIFSQFVFLNFANLKSINRIEGEEIFELYENEKECIIINKNLNLYTDQHAHKYPDMTRSVFLWSPILSRRKTIHYLGDEKQGVWILTPVEGHSSSVYYIANAKFGEHLYATPMKKLESTLSNRRSIFLDRTFITDRKDLSEEHMWEFRKLNNGLYEIWNVKYNEPLYVPDLLLRKLLLTSGDVYTWRYFPDGGDQFQWNVKCLDQREP